jgi:hypothetical protein
MTQVIGKMKLLKWWMPLLLVAALVAAGGLAWSQSGSGGVFDTSNLPQLTDANPAYDDEIVTVPEVVPPVVLYSLAMDPSTSVIPLGGGDITTVTLTNLISEPLAVGPYGRVLDQTTGMLKSVNVMANGDITGDVVVTADVYNNLYVYGCLTTYNSNTSVVNYTTNGLPSASVVVKVMRNITVHPGGSVSFIVLVAPGMGAVSGAEFLLKASLFLPGTFTGLTNGVPTTGAITWKPGWYVSDTYANPTDSTVTSAQGQANVFGFGP